MKVMSVMFFPNGNTAVFDEDGKQIPELQESWILEYKKLLKRNKVENIYEIDITMPDGRNAKYMEKHNNWRIEK